MFYLAASGVLTERMQQAWSQRWIRQQEILWILFVFKLVFSIVVVSIALSNSDNKYGKIGFVSISRIEI